MAAQSGKQKAFLAYAFGKPMAYTGANMRDAHAHMNLTEAHFNAVAGQQYLIRLGSYPGEPGGTGSLTISCGPPNNPSCPAAGGCCSAGSWVDAGTSTDCPGTG